MEQKIELDQRTPFPTLGEVMRFLIEAFGFNEGMFADKHVNAEETEKERKKFRRRLNRFADEKDFNMEEAQYFIDETFGKYINLICPNELLSLGLNNCFSFFLMNYKDLVLHVNTQAYSREQIISFCLLEYIANYSTDFVLIVKDISLFKELQVPEEEFWYLYTFDDDKLLSPIAKVLDWWVERTGQNNLKELSSCISELKEVTEYGYEEWRTHYNRNLRWKNEVSLPKANSILELAQKDFELKENEESLKLSLIINLFIARASQYSIGSYFKFSKKGAVSDYKHFFKHWTQEYLLDYEEIEMLDYNIYLENFQKYLPFCRFKNILQSRLAPCLSPESLELLKLLKEKTSIELSKQKDDIYYPQKLIKGLKSDVVVSYSYKYCLLWYEARFLVLNCELDRAAEFYYEAFEAGKYCAGSLLKEIIREGYTVAAFIERKDILKKMHSWGVAYKLFEEHYKEVKDWIIVVQKQQFFQIFNVNSFYRELSGDKKVFIERLYDNHRNFHPVKLKYNEVWLEEEVYESKDEINRLDEYNFMQYNQVMKFAITGQINKLNLALERGGNANITNNDNSTALILSLINNNFDIALRLLDEKVITKSINRTSYKQKMTALGALIDSILQADRHDDLSSHLNILDRMIEREVDINMKYDHNQVSPFYACLRLLVHLEKDNKTLDSKEAKVDYNFLNRISSRDYDIRRKSGQIDSKSLSDEWQRRYSNDGRMKSGSESVKKKVIEREEYYRAIIERLLACEKIDVNQVEFHNYTALVMAAQLGEKAIFEKLLAKGADLYYDGLGASVFEYCLDYHKYELAVYILDNYDKEKIIKESKDLDFRIVELYTNYIGSDNFSIKDKKFIDQIIIKLNPFSIKIIIHFIGFQSTGLFEECKGDMKIFRMFCQFNESRDDAPQFDKNPQNCLNFWNDYKVSIDKLKSPS